MPFYGPVDHEAVYYLTHKRAVHVPPPPTMLNDGNYIGSMSRLSALAHAERAEKLEAAIVRATWAIVSDGRRRQRLDGRPRPR